MIARLFTRPTLDDVGSHSRTFGVHSLLIPCPRSDFRPLAFVPQAIPELRAFEGGRVPSPSPTVARRPTRARQWPAEIADREAPSWTPSELVICSFDVLSAPSVSVKSHATMESGGQAQTPVSEARAEPYDVGGPAHPEQPHDRRGGRFPAIRCAGQECQLSVAALY